MWIIIVAAPLARGTMGYQGIAEKDVYDVLADVQKRFPIDADRIYLTGISMGGGGALRLALTRPDVWAAVAVVCPAEVPDAREFASNASNLPVRVFQGALDPVVPAAMVRGWSADLRQLGARVEYREYPMVKHNSWDYAYQGGTVFNWFAGFKREGFPARVRFTTRSYQYRTAYWVELDGLTPGNLASIDAKFTAINEIEVQTAGLDGFTLRPAGHLMYEPGLAASVKVDGSPLKVAPRAALSFSKTQKGWRAARVCPSGQLERSWTGRSDRRGGEPPALVRLRDRGFGRRGRTRAAARASRIRGELGRSAPADAAFSPHCPGPGSLRGQRAQSQPGAVRH